MHPITVRTMKFELPKREEYHPLCIAGNSSLSYSHLAMGILVAYLEPFFVKALRRVLDKIEDENLRENVDRFARQEAQHYQRHKEFNEVVFAQDYPGLAKRVEKLIHDLDYMLEHASDKNRLGYIEGFESYTTQFAIFSLSIKLYDHPRTNREFGQLFKWHMLEEVEHRNVAYDVYQELFGGYLYRAYMCWRSQSHMFRFLNDCSAIMSKTDVERYGESCRITWKQKIKLKIHRFKMRIRTMLPLYTPHNYVLPKNIVKLSAFYTGLAESVR